MTSKRQPTSMRRVPVRLEWDASPIINEDTVEFAASLKRSLNASTADGYSLCFHVKHGENLVLVHQRVTEIGAQAISGQEEPKGTEVH